MFTTYNGTPDPNMGITKPLLAAIDGIENQECVYSQSFVFTNNHVLQNFPFLNEMLRHTIFHSCLHNIFQNRSMCISLHKLHPKNSTFLRRLCGIFQLWNIFWPFYMTRVSTVSSQKSLKVKKMRCYVPRECDVW